MPEQQPQQQQQQMTEEQVQELQEKIKNMSPEELKEFQKKQCIFCQIIAGKVQSKKVYEDDKSIAILDINPANPGHVLLLPKEHYSIMPQLSEDEIAHLFMVSKTLSNSVLRSLGVQGTNIIVQNGVAAGQKAQHFMIHIIPRKEGDDLNFEIPQREIPENQLEEIRKKLEAKLGEVKQQEPKPQVQELIAKQQPVEAQFKETPKEAPKEEPNELSKNEKLPNGSEEGLQNSKNFEKGLEKPGVFQKKPRIQERKQKPKQQKPKKTTKKETKNKPKEKQKNESAGLDDIARILGVK